MPRTQRAHQKAKEEAERKARNDDFLSRIGQVDDNRYATAPTSRERYPVRSDLSWCDVELNDVSWLRRYDKFFVEPTHPLRGSSRWHMSWVGELKGTSDGCGYFCPSGWRRFSLDASESLKSAAASCLGTSNEKAFFSNSSIMYHGTSGKNVLSIIKDGFRPNECQHGVKAVYLSPSIRYTAHPRYAKVYKSCDGHYFQIALEVRVHNELVKSFKGETMQVNNDFQIDPNFRDNNGMEFLFEHNGPRATGQDGLVVTGIMMRCAGKTDPLELPGSEWWTCWNDADSLHQHHYYYR